MRGRLIGVLLAFGLLAGCAKATPTESPGPVEVTGDFGAIPNVTFDYPRGIDTGVVDVLFEGNGEVTARGEVVLLDVYAVDAATTEVVVNTYGRTPRTLTLDPEVIGPELFQALIGRPAGSRILLESAADNLVTVLDIHTIRAEGTELAPVAGLPAVRLAADGEPTVDVTGVVASTDAVIAPTIRGPGAQVDDGALVTVQYVEIDLASGEVLDSTWADNRTPYTTRLTSAGAMPGWIAGLTGQTVGSQVLLVLPPRDALNDGRSLVFVIDILRAVPIKETS
jgi:peptidylprolyl isomerase